MYEELTERIKEMRKTEFFSSYNLFDLIPISLADTLSDLMGMKETLRRYLHTHNLRVNAENKILKQKLLLDLRRFLWV